MLPRIKDDDSLNLFENKLCFIIPYCILSSEYDADENKSLFVHEYLFIPNF